MTVRHVQTVYYIELASLVSADVHNITLAAACDEWQTVVGYALLDSSSTGWHEIVSQLCDSSRLSVNCLSISVNLQAVNFSLSMSFIFSGQVFVSVTSLIATSVAIILKHLIILIHQVAPLYYYYIYGAKCQQWN